MMKTLDHQVRNQYTIKMEEELIQDKFEKEILFIEKELDLFKIA